MTLAESSFLRACRCQSTERTPVWFMRQAGRSLPEYRELRKSGSILDAICDPELSCEITLQPVRRYGVDAAILFSDIVVPLVAIGLGIEIVPGTGPVIDHAFGSDADISRLRPFEPDIDAPYLSETIRLLVGQLDVPLIGFAGAPFTLASYLVEGGPSRTFTRTKALMHEHPNTWFALVERLADIAIASLTCQIASGASAIQLFDSWAGALSRSDYARYVQPYSARVLEAIECFEVPRIHFGIGTSHLLDLMGDAGADVVGVDWRLPLDVAARKCGAGRAVQGNLDPEICLGTFETVRDEAQRVLEEGARTPGFIFNLGHGVLPDTDPSILERLVAFVHEYEPAKAAAT